jgi:hypothetical protein
VKVLATGGDDRRVNVWALGKPNALMSLTGHTSAVECVTFDSQVGIHSSPENICPKMYLPWGKKLFYKNKTNAPAARIFISLA